MKIFVNQKSIFKRGSDVSVIMSEDEFNGCVRVFDALLSTLKEAGSSEGDVSKYERVRTSLVDFSYFDVEAREAHARFMPADLAIMIKALQFFADMATEDDQTAVTFEERAKDPNSNKWEKR